MSFGWESLGIKIGVATTTTVKVLVCSLISDGITLGGTTITPTAIGTDRGSNDAGGVTADGGAIAASQTAGYSAIFTITGLAAGTSYSATVTQGNASVVVNYKTMPEAGSDFSLFFISCNRQGDHADPSGLYSYIKQYSQNGEYDVAGVFHIDDTVYTDEIEVDDTASGFTGKSSTGKASTTRFQHDYAMGYLNDLGLFGDPYQTNSDDNDYNHLQGHSAARKWVYRNLPTFHMWGDHEFTDDMGFDNDAKASATWAPAIAVWDLTYGGIMPDGMAGTSDHTEGQHFGVTIGDVYIGVMDGVTMGEGDAASNGTLYGNTQIDEMIAGFSGSSAAFKILGIGHGIRHLHATLKTITYGANNSLANNVSTEYARLITASGGIQFEWNSAPGFVITGDYHNSYAYKHEETATAVVNESFIEINTGTVNGSQNHDLDASITVGASINDATALYVDPNKTASTYDFNCIRVDVLGSGSTKKIRTNLIDKNWNVVWSGEWQDGQSGNLPSGFTMDKI